MVLVVLQTQIYAAAKSDIGTAKVNFDRAAKASFELGSKAGFVGWNSGLFKASFERVD